MNNERSVYKNSFRCSRHSSQYAERLIIHSLAEALHLSPPFGPLTLSNPGSTPALPSCLHKLYNVRCRNKVDHLRAIHLFSYLARFLFYPFLPISPSFSLFPPAVPNGLLSKLLWPLTKRMENDEDDDDDNDREWRRHWYSVDVRELHFEDRLAVGACREIFTGRYELTRDGDEELRIDREFGINASDTKC